MEKPFANLPSDSDLKDRKALCHGLLNLIRKQRNACASGTSMSRDRRIGSLC